MTININRLVQNKFRESAEEGSGCWGNCLHDFLADLSGAVEKQVEKIHKYLIAFNSIVKDMESAHMIPIYDAGFISPEKQYLTVGIL